MMLPRRSLPVVMLLLLFALFLLLYTEYWAFLRVDSYLEGGLMGGRNDTSTNETLPACTKKPSNGNVTHQVIVKNVGTPTTSGKLVHGPDHAKVLVSSNSTSPSGLQSLFLQYENELCR